MSEEVIAQHVLFRSQWLAVSASDLSVLSVLATPVVLAASSVSQEEGAACLGSLLWVEIPTELFDKPSAPTLLARHLLDRSSGALAVSLTSQSGAAAVLSRPCTRVEVIEVCARRNKLLVGYGTFVLEVRSLLSLELLAVFDSAAVSMLSGTSCAGAGFVEAAGLPMGAHADGEADTWVAMAFQVCGESTLSHHLCVWEMHASALSIKTQSCPLARKNMVSVKVCPRRSDSVLLGIGDDGKVWHYRQDLRSSFAGPMYPPGYAVLSEISTYAEAEDELDRVVLDARRPSGEDAGSSATVAMEVDDDIDMPATGPAQELGSEVRLLCLPVSIGSYAALSGMGGQTETPKPRALIPLPKQVFKATKDSKVSCSAVVCCYASAS